MTSKRLLRWQNRVAIVAVVAGVLAGSYLWAEEPTSMPPDAAPPSDATPPSNTAPSAIAAPTPEEAADDLMNRVEAQLKDGSAVGESAAVEMLAAAHALPTDIDRKYRSQFLHMMAVWNVAVLQAFQDANGENGLLETIAQHEKLLEEKNLAEEVRPIGRLYLALYYYKKQDLKKLRETVAQDSLAKSMASENVWPGFRGMYWNFRGLLATEDANFALAWDCHSKALAARRAAQLPPDEAESLNNLSYLLMKLGDYASAKQFLEEAIAIHEAVRAKTKENESIAELFAELNLAKAREASRDYEQSAAQLEQLLARIQVLADNYETRQIDCYCRNNLAIGRFSLGQFKSCEQLLTECRPKAVAAFGENHVHVAELDVNLGWTGFATGQSELADREFSAALKLLQERHPGHHRIPEVMGYLARVWASRQPEAARTLLEEALTIHEQGLDATLPSALSERDRLAYIQQLRVHPESLAWPGVFDTYLQLAPQIGVPVADQYRHVLAWKGALANNAPRTAADRASKQIRELEADYGNVRRRLLTLTQQQDDDLQHGDEIVRLELDANRLERELRGHHRANATARNPLSTQDVADALPRGAAFLDIVEIRGYRQREDGEPIADDRSYLGFIVKSDGQASRFEFGPASPIDREVDRFVKRISERRTFQGAPLNKLFASRLREQLGDVKLLVVSADGVLQRLSWCALPGIQHNYWAEELTIAQAASARSYVMRQKTTGEPPAKQWLAVGDVAHGEGERFAVLPSTGKEAEQVGEILRKHFPEPAEKDAAGNSHVLIGRQATKSRVLELLPNCRFAHIATHGDFFRGDADAFAVLEVSRSLDSALAFSGANDDPTGGVESLLTAEEIGGMDLSKVDLVVLSACETGLGHISAGQGLVGLPGALDRANVRSAVTALWKVDDTATAKLMSRFYDRLFQTPGELRFAQALREAQIDLLRQSEYAHPYYWAAWSVGGSPIR